MSVYTYIVKESKGDETLIMGDYDKQTVINLITVTNNGAAFQFSLLLTWGGVTTTIYAESLDDGSLIDTNKYEIGAAVSLKVLCTPGVNITIIGETSKAGEKITNSIPSNI